MAANAERSSPPFLEAQDPVSSAEIVDGGSGEGVDIFSIVSTQTCSTPVCDTDTNVQKTAVRGGIRASV